MSLLLFLAIAINFASLLINASLAVAERSVAPAIVAGLNVAVIVCCLMDSLGA